MKVGRSGIFNLYDKNKYGIVKNTKMYLKIIKAVKDYKLREFKHLFNQTHHIP